MLTICTVVSSKTTPKNATVILLHVVSKIYNYTFTNLIRYPSIKLNTFIAIYIISN
nr:MAG TPA: hypothetical protein [Caudoviricetes sp.]